MQTSYPSFMKTYCHQHHFSIFFRIDVAKVLEPTCVLFEGKINAHAYAFFYPPLPATAATPVSPRSLVSMTIFSVVSSCVFLLLKNVTAVFSLHKHIQHNN